MLTCPSNENRINAMKTLINLTLLLTTFVTVGCTVYPKNYTYSPSVAVGGSNDGNLVLPSPFAKTNPKTVETTIEKTLVPRHQASYSYEPQPSPLTTYVPEPPVSVDYYPSNYYPERTVVFLGNMEAR